jgi:type 1 glutamine amidotransferase
MFYDWENFQTLTGGAWEKGTFHPRMQEIKVNIADKTHPVTRGMSDFETFDEPWQKTANRNPQRHVLLTGVVSQANGGSASASPSPGRRRSARAAVFNLVLGHDAKAKIGNPRARS